MKKLYLLLAIAGFVVPYYFFLSFLLANGLNVGLLLSQLFANDISSFFAVDLIITAVVLMIFVYRDSQRLGMGNWWIYIVATLTIGPSFALPLFLYVRESQTGALASEARSQPGP
jgi:hypothetical protein